MTGSGGGAQPARRRSMSAPQQKPRQCEEHRDRKIEATEQPTVDPTRVPGREREVGDDDADARAGPHPFHGGQEAAGSTHLLAVSHAPLSPASGWGYPQPRSGEGAWPSSSLRSASSPARSHPNSVPVLAYPTNRVHPVCPPWGPKPRP